jgi:galactokinase
MSDKNSLPDEVNRRLVAAAKGNDLNVLGGHVRRSSSRFCLGVEHGDYNGTELFGVGTDRFIWMAYKPNGTDKVRLFSENFPDDGVVEFRLGDVPAPGSAENHHSWARFPMGVDYVLQREGYAPQHGFDAVLYGNIPGGGMSRSASVSLNLILTFFEVNKISGVDGMRTVELAQAVENDYIGSPCGNLDQIMILFARAGHGTHYIPKTRSVEYVPLGETAIDFHLVSLDTGTVRPGLEKSTYKIRRAECEQLVELVGPKFGISCLADVQDQQLYNRIVKQFNSTHPDLCQRLDYIYHAQQRFGEMLSAWKSGDVATVGQIFRADGYGLRDDYEISGPELETMCDIAREVPGVLGERMLGGGDKGASGALVAADAVESLRHVVDTKYPELQPEFAEKYAVHDCRAVDGMCELPGLVG